MAPAEDVTDGRVTWSDVEVALLTCFADLPIQVTAAELVAAGFQLRNSGQIKQKRRRSGSLDDLSLRELSTHIEAVETVIESLEKRLTAAKAYNAQLGTAAEEAVLKMRALREQ